MRLAAIAVGLLVSVQAVADDFIEIKAELNSTWHSTRGSGLPIENHHTVTVRCVVGTNTWFMEGDFSQNATITYWCIGTNIVAHHVITKQLPERPESQRTMRFVWDSPPVGHRYTQIYSSPRGEPTGGGVENVVWLAFCSGTYLKTEGRQIPFLIGPGSLAFGYSDKTTVFEDEFGLPKTVELYSVDNQLACDYRVLESTNFMGWNFPSSFKLVVHGQPYNGRMRGTSWTEVSGRLISIGDGRRPEIPKEVMNATELRVLPAPGPRER